MLLQLLGLASDLSRGWLTFIAVLKHNPPEYNDNTDPTNRLVVITTTTVTQPGHRSMGRRSEYQK